MLSLTSLSYFTQIGQNFIDISASNDTVYGIKDDGTVWEWNGQTSSSKFTQIDIIDAEACKSRDWNLVRKILSGKSEPETDINGSLEELTLFQWVKSTSCASITLIS